MAKIINKTTPEIILNTRTRGDMKFITLLANCLFLSKTLVAEVGIKKNMYFHCINDGKYWAFFINNDPDGFTITQDKTGTCRIGSRALLKMIKQSTGRTTQDRLLVKKSHAERNGCPIYEIHTSETIKELKSNEMEVVLKKKHTLTVRPKRLIKT